MVHAKPNSINRFPFWHRERERVYLPVGIILIDQFNQRQRVIYPKTFNWCREIFRIPSLLCLSPNRKTKLLRHMGNISKFLFTSAKCVFFFSLLLFFIFIILILLVFQRSHCKGVNDIKKIDFTVINVWKVYGASHFFFIYLESSPKSLCKKQMRRVHLCT